jgi:hypothetical protein
MLVHMRTTLINVAIVSVCAVLMVHSALQVTVSRARAGTAHPKSHAHGAQHAVQVHFLKVDMAGQCVFLISVKKQSVWQFRGPNPQTDLDTTKCA